MKRAELDELLAPAFEAFRREVTDLVFAEVSTLVSGARSAALDALMKAFRQGGETVAAPPVKRRVTTAKRKVARTRRSRSVAHAGSNPAPDTSTARAPIPAETASTPIRMKAASAPAPSILSAIDRSAPPKKYSVAEIERAKQRIAERRARQATPPPQHAAAA